VIMFSELPPSSYDLLYEVEETGVPTKPNVVKKTSVHSGLRLATLYP